MSTKEEQKQHLIDMMKQQTLEATELIKKWNANPSEYGLYDIIGGLKHIGTQDSLKLMLHIIDNEEYDINEILKMVNNLYNMAQTSVEFIVHELSAIIGPLESNPMTDLLIVDAIKKAMEMHKDESISYAKDFAKQMLENKRFVNAEIIYNETFGGNK